MKKIITILIWIVTISPFVLTAQNTAKDDGSKELAYSKQLISQPKLRLEQLNIALEKENKDALVELGDLFFSDKRYYDQNIQRDVKKALEYYQQAADLGYADGFFGIYKVYNSSGGFRNNEKATEALYKAGNLGSLKAMRKLGDNAFNGGKRYQDAYQWYKKALDAGDKDAEMLVFSAQRAMGAEKVTKDNNASDFEKGVAYLELDQLRKVNYSDINLLRNAEKWFRMGVDKGDHRAMTALGTLRMRMGGIIDISAQKEAIKLFEKAAKLGNEKAMFHLGKIHQEGKYVKKNYLKAMDWYTKATEKDDTEAWLAMGNLYNWGLHDRKESHEKRSKKPSKAWDCYQKASALGNPEAYFKQGQMLESGFAYIDESIRFDYEDAGVFYEKAIFFGVEEAKKTLEGYKRNFDFTMGKIHYSHRDYVKAAELFEKSVKYYGHLLAHRYLAEMYEKGIGVEPDNLKAFYHWARVGAATGDIEAKKNAVRLYDNSYTYHEHQYDQFKKDIAKYSADEQKKVVAYEQSLKEAEQAYQQMLYDRRNREPMKIGSSWRGFTYDQATQNAYNRTSREWKEKRDFNAYKSYLDYKFGK